MAHSFYAPFHQFRKRPLRKSRIRGYIADNPVSFHPGWWCPVESSRAVAASIRAGEVTGTSNIRSPRKLPSQYVPWYLTAADAAPKCVVGGINSLLAILFCTGLKTTSTDGVSQIFGGPQDSILDASPTSPAINNVPSRSQWILSGWNCPSGTRTAARCPSLERIHNALFVQAFT